LDGKMPRPRPAGLKDSYTRFILWVDTEAMDDAGMDAMVTAVLQAVERFTPAAHVEMPLGLA